MNMIVTPEEFGLNPLGAAHQQPYIATNGKNAGKSCIQVNTGQLDKNGQPEVAEQVIANAATLRKDEWINLDNQLLSSARERLVIVGDMMAKGLTYNAGGLGTMIAEWETGSEITDAEIAMDGESKSSKDKQNFGLNGVPIPVIRKEWSIGQRSLMASRQRGASLDVTTGTEASRAVARASEGMVFNGVSITKKTYPIYGLTTFPSRATTTISDWADAGTTTATILANIFAMVKELETNQRSFGPYTLYIPGAYLSRFREDFKANSDKTLMTRVLDEASIVAIRASDVLAAGNVVLVQMTSDVLDLAIASDLTTVQWQSGSGWTNNFQTYAAWAPRLKADYDGRCGICHGSV